MTEITYVVTIIASISFVMFIIYPLLKGEKLIFFHLWVSKNFQEYSLSSKDARHVRIGVCQL